MERVGPNSDILLDDVVGMFEAAAICDCCGRTLNHSAGRNKALDNPSLDRVNNALGYIKGNVAVICWNCNQRKTDLTLEDLQRLIRYIKRYQ